MSPPSPTLINAFLLQTTREPGTSNPKINYLDYALKVFDEMLQRRPLPSVVRFTQILSQLVKLEHYYAVISLNRQMLLCRIAPDDYTLSIIINCYCHLNHMGFSRLAYLSWHNSSNWVVNQMSPPSTL
ncbi:hypothetical protein RchiOBHm_Chr5g0069261 [Rosa chinensis]|uniref:Pentatricopeptide n=1 Tax=Rosa chinensis TaxID=74649 RepID=A0A2P6QJU9_ROSCH|nr:hypothetical protein RchiOBHm_Chr5g0069261 [Rosa chinensis]